MSRNFTAPKSTHSLFVTEAGHASLNMDVVARDQLPKQVFDGVVYFEIYDGTLEQVKEHVEDLGLEQSLYRIQIKA